MGRMPTCGNDKLLFVHVPKTGGMWAWMAMRHAGVEVEPEGDEWHIGLENLDIRGRFTLGFVREPLAYYASAWAFRRKEGLEAMAHPVTQVYQPFAAFLKGCVERVPGHLSRQYEHFLGPAGSPVDFIGRYENLEDDLVTALTLASQDFDEDALRAFPPVNASGPAPECPEDVKALLMASESVAYERFYSLVPA